jgi:DNA-binding IclR family transcriptional regulator
MSHQHLAATFQPNGTPLRALRFAIFGTSLVSDYGNPLATTVRAIMRALMARGHEVTFLEERRNQPTLALLRDRGAAPMRLTSAIGPTSCPQAPSSPSG